jgi:hypothetical protein
MARTLRYHPYSIAMFVKRPDGTVAVPRAWAKVLSKSCARASTISSPTRIAYALSSVGCRYIKLRRFPYVILFDVTDDELLMVGVLHTARSPEKWRDRLAD